MYLPKKWPSNPIPSLGSAFDLHPASAAYKTVSLPPVLPDKFCSRAKTTMPIVEASITSMPSAVRLPGSSCPTHRASHILQGIRFP